MALGAAVRTGVFWTLAGAFFVGNFTTNSVTVHLIPYLSTRGYSPALAASMIGWMGAMQLPARLVFAPITARFGHATITAMIFFVQAVALVQLVLAARLPTLAPMVIMLGAANGVSTLVRATMIAELFGPRHYGSISGAVALGAHGRGPAAGGGGGLRACVLDARGLARDGRHRCVAADTTHSTVIGSTSRSSRAATAVPGRPERMGGLGGARSPPSSRTPKEEGMRKIVLLAVAGVLAAAAPAFAQKSYPSRPIEVIVPFAPGGGTDNLMRTIVAIIDENKWSPVPINVINRPGGSGVVGYTYVINKKGDPYVIAGGSPTIVSAKVEGRLPADHRGGFTTLMIVAIDELMLSVRTESKFQTIEDFVKAAKERPGQLTVAGTGTNSEDHIFTHLLEKAAGIKVKYVPFQSGGECVTALMGGHVDAGVMNPNEIIAQIDAKKARNLAVAAKKRMPDATDVPTFAEKGYEFFWEQMRGVVGTAKMPPEAVKWWQDALKKVVGSKRWQENYIKRNLLTPVEWTGEEANQYLDGLRAKYEKALGEMGAIKR